MKKRIENDEQYEKAREWCLSAADRLEDPLLDTEEYAKTMRVYDATQRLMGLYRRGEMVRDLPYLAGVYAECGVEYQKFEEGTQ